MEASTRTGVESWTAEGRGIGLACSITATPTKVEGDAKNAKKNYPDLRVLIFSTAREVTQHTAKGWAKEVLDKFGLQLIVVPREEFITWLHDPANSDICRDQLGIAPSMTPELAPALERAREAAKEVAENWDRVFRRTERPVISLNAVKLNEKGDPIDAVTTASLKSVLAKASESFSKRRRAAARLRRSSNSRGTRWPRDGWRSWWTCRSGSGRARTFCRTSQRGHNSRRGRWTRRCSQNCAETSRRFSCSTDGTKCRSPARKPRTRRCESLTGVSRGDCHRCHAQA